MTVLTLFENQVLYADEDRWKDVFPRMFQWSLTPAGNRILKAGHRQIGVGSWCGIVPVSSNLVLEILPKTGGEDGGDSRRMLFKMLHKVGFFPSFRHVGRGPLDSGQTSLIELFIKAYIDDVARLAGRGLAADYDIRAENLSYLKGKILTGRNIRENRGLRNRHYVEYDEYLTDTPANRIIKTCLHYLSRISRQTENLRRIKELLIRFDGVGYSSSYKDDLAKIHYHRQNDYYEPVVRWSIAFLSGLNPAPTRGKIPLPSLIFPMDKLFETYVTRILKEQRQCEGWKITAQSSRYSLAREGEVERFQIRPDIICERDEELIIADAKWKLLDRRAVEDKYDIHQGDLYQLLSYATVYRSLGYQAVSIEIYYPENPHFSEPLLFTCNDPPQTVVKILPVKID